MQVNHNSLFVVPEISDTLQQFLVAIIIDEIIRPGNFEKCQQHLNAYCENRQLNYLILESNLRLFFALLDDYNQSNDPVLYYYLKLQAVNCLLDEQSFALLPIVPPWEACMYDSNFTSANHYGLVGGHLIGF